MLYNTIQSSTYYQDLSLFDSIFMLFILQGIATSRGAQLFTLKEVLDKQYKSGLVFSPLSGLYNNKLVEPLSSRIPERSSSYFDTLDLTETDDLNARIAFAALSLLKERAEVSQSGLEVEVEYRPYDVFSKIDVMLEDVQKSLQCRPPCRFELHNTTATVEKKTSDRRTGDSSCDNMIESDEIEVPVQVVLDVGHNPAAMEALSNKIKMYFPSRGIR
jgi:hypothetical protein